MVNTALLNLRYSVLMSVYKKENSIFLSKSLESMLKQTIAPSEIIIVKDGKLTEELDQTLNEFKNLYPEIIKIIESSENVGLGKALNLGLKNCKYSMIARMDTDDISLPNRCEKQLNLFYNNPELSLVGSWVDEFVDDEKSIISTRKVPCEHSEIYEYCKRRNPFNHPSVMYLKKSVLEVGGYSDMRFGQDYDLFGRMMIKGCKAQNIGESLLLFRTTNDTIKRRKNWNSIKKLSQYS